MPMALAMNGPQVHDSVKLNAGLEKRFQHLAANRTAKAKLPINEEHNEVIELVVKDGKQLDLPKLKQLLARNNMDSTAIYQWQNHYVLFGKVQDLGVMQGRIQNNFPETEVKAYHDMFYEYSKKKHCADKSVAKEWTHILLTANLVADKKLQQEYLDYHATQFEKWPDIAKGFCNADFQQLLLFRNGRQLVLVISIPKGKTLDELNPKTVENNAKMLEWNKIMGKYQEGIEGTKKGETWVFLR
jgi:L-rhamnose mutarotase